VGEWRTGVWRECIIIKEWYYLQGIASGLPPSISRLGRTSPLRFPENLPGYGLALPTDEINQQTHTHRHERRKSSHTGTQTCVPTGLLTTIGCYGIASRGLTDHLASTTPTNNYLLDGNVNNVTPQRHSSWGRGRPIDVSRIPVLCAQRNNRFNG